MFYGELKMTVVFKKIWDVLPLAVVALDQRHYPFVRCLDRFIPFENRGKPKQVQAISQNTAPFKAPKEVAQSSFLKGAKVEKVDPNSLHHKIRVFPFTA